jgi:hypothetical protein
MYVALALPFRLIGADRTDPPASACRISNRDEAAATSSEQHAAKSRSARRNRQHMRERATCGHPCAQLASGLATSTGLDKVVFAKPEGRARIKSMERYSAAVGGPPTPDRPRRSERVCRRRGTYAFTEGLGERNSGLRARTWGRSVRSFRV